jgi:hypothetical protein
MKLQGRKWLYETNRWQLGWGHDAKRFYFGYRKRMKR